MLSFVANEEITVTVPLTRDGEPFVADDSSVKWSLRDHSGAAMAGYVDQAPEDASNTSLAIKIPAAANQITNGRQFEKRFLTITGLVEGASFNIRTPYRVTPWLNHTVSADNVRAFIGTDPGELPDADIDLAVAYFTISDRLGAVALEAALDSGGKAEQTANDAIKAQAVLDVLPGMRARMSKREEDGLMKVERFQIDFDAIAAAAGVKLREADALIGNINDAATVPTLFVLTTPTPDLFPGA